MQLCSTRAFNHCQLCSFAARLFRLSMRLYKNKSIYQDHLLMNKEKVNQSKVSATLLTVKEK